MRPWLVPVVTFLAVWLLVGVFYARMAYRYPTALNADSLRKARKVMWCAHPGLVLIWPWIVLGNWLRSKRKEK